MTDGTLKVFCQSCGREVSPDHLLGRAERTPCPDCGSFDRHAAVSFDLKIGVGVGMRAVGRAPGRKKPVLEARAEPTVQKSTGRPVFHERLIDRRQDLYKETVTDNASGNVIHKTEEPLSAHQGHGSAKPPKAPSGV